MKHGNRENVIRNPTLKGETNLLILQKSNSIHTAPKAEVENQSRKRKVRLKALQNQAIYSMKSEWNMTTKKRILQSYKKRQNKSFA